MKLCQREQRHPSTRFEASVTGAPRLTVGRRKTHPGERALALNGGKVPAGLYVPLHSTLKSEGLLERIIRRQEEGRREEGERRQHHPGAPYLTLARWKANTGITATLFDLGGVGPVRTLD
ncbi:hypothetical protein WMY93_026093 [Mugilogobius chulae]|uniref:Uncharacterized protein n=1 Tax=Mugilogobius chulae TaxID=88201 RepID=A0AAW0MWH7_9GOBI